MAWVQDDPPVVGIAGNVVPVCVGRPDQGGVRVLELERGIQVVIIIGEVADALDLGGDVVAGIGLVPGFNLRGSPPAGVGEVAVHGDRPLGPPDSDHGAFGLRGRGSGGEADEPEGIQYFGR